MQPKRPPTSRWRSFFSSRVACMAIEIYGVTMRYLMQHLVKNKQNEKQLTPSLIKADKSLELGDVIQNMPSYDGDKTSLLDSISNACTLVLILVFWLMSGNSALYAMSAPALFSF